MQEITRLIIYKAKKQNIPTQRQETPPQKNKIHFPMTEDPFLKMEGQVTILKGQISL
jgi:hypothetical protein